MVDWQIVVPVVLAAFGGVCFLLWNTDGSLDVIATAAGVLLAVLWLLTMIWNFALTVAASSTWPVVSVEQNKRVATAIHAHDWDSSLQGVMIGAAIFLNLVPLLISAARRNRRQP